MHIDSNGTLERRQPAEWLRLEYKGYVKKVFPPLHVDGCSVSVRAGALGRFPARVCLLTTQLSRQARTPRTHSIFTHSSTPLPDQLVNYQAPPR
jgi:hypothetical protein